MAKADFVFADWLEASELSDSTKAVLEKQMLVSRRALKSVLSAELGTLGLPLGQLGLLPECSRHSRALL